MVLKIIGAACLIAGGLAIETVPEARHQEMLEQFAPLVRDIAGDVDVTLIETEAADLFSDAAVSTSQPSTAHMAQENIASAFITGRAFLAAGNPVASSTVETTIDSQAPEPPKGWRLEDDTLIHNESGLECPASFSIEAEDETRELVLKAINTYDARGRDVSCNFAIDGAVSITVYASFYPEMSAEEHAAGAVSAMRQLFQLKGVLPVITIELANKDDDEPTEAPLAGAFDIGEVNGVPYKTAIWLAKTGGWHVKTRATYPQSDIGSEITAALMFAANYINVQAKDRANPTTSGSDV